MVFLYTAIHIRKCQHFSIFTYIGCTYITCILKYGICIYSVYIYWQYVHSIYAEHIALIRGRVPAIYVCPVLLFKLYFRTINIAFLLY